MSVPALRDGSFTCLLGGLRPLSLSEPGFLTRHMHVGARVSMRLDSSPSTGKCPAWLLPQLLRGSWEDVILVASLEAFMKGLLSAPLRTSGHPGHFVGCPHLRGSYLNLSPLRPLPLTP